MEPYRQLVLERQIERDEDILVEEERRERMGKINEIRGEKPYEKRSSRKP